MGNDLIESVLKKFVDKETVENAVDNLMLEAEEPKMYTADEAMSMMASGFKLRPYGLVYSHDKDEGYRVHLGDDASCISNNRRQSNLF